METLRAELRRWLRDHREQKGLYIYDLFDRVERRLTRKFREEKRRRMKKVTGTKHIKQNSSSPKVGAKIGLAGGKHGSKSGLTKKN